MECGKNTSICIFPNYNFGPWNLLYLHVCGYFKQYSSFSMLCVKHVHNSSLILVSDSYVCDKIRFLLPFKIFGEISNVIVCLSKKHNKSMATFTFSSFFFAWVVGWCNGGGDVELGAHNDLSHSEFFLCGDY